MARLRFFAILMMTVLFLASCAMIPAPKPVDGASRFNRIHHCLTDGSDIRLPKKLLLLSVDIEVSEMSARGQQEELYELSESSTRLVSDVVKKYFVQNKDFTIIDTPPFNEADRELIDQHLALHDLVMGNILRYQGKGWQHKIDRPDSTIGNKLAFLAAQAGAGGAIIVTGGQTVASGGRLAAALVFAALGSVVSTGHAFLNISIIDFNTGNILWTNTQVDVYSSLKTERGVTQLANRGLAGLQKIK